MDESTTDLDLLRRFAATSDGEAFAQLAQRHEPGMLGLASGLIGTPNDLAVEAVQLTWIRVMKYAGSFRGSSSVKTWLYRILINQCRSLQRKMHAQSQSAKASAEQSPAPRNELSPTGEAEREFLRAVSAAVNALPAQHREVVLLCYHAEMSHALAAEVLQIPIGTLKSRLNASLTKLRQSLGAEVQA